MWITEVRLIVARLIILIGAAEANSILENA